MGRDSSKSQAPNFGSQSSIRPTPKTCDCGIADLPWHAEVLPQGTLYARWPPPKENPPGEASWARMLQYQARRYHIIFPVLRDDCPPKPEREHGGIRQLVERALKQNAEAPASASGADGERYTDLIQLQRREGDSTEHLAAELRRCGNHPDLIQQRIRRCGFRSTGRVAL